MLGNAFNLGTRCLNDYLWWGAVNGLLLLLIGNTLATNNRDLGDMCGGLGACSARNAFSTGGATLSGSSALGELGDVVVGLEGALCGDLIPAEFGGVRREQGLRPRVPWDGWGFHGRSCGGRGSGGLNWLVSRSRPGGGGR